MTDGPNAQPVTACSLFLEPTFMSGLNRAVRAEEDQNGTVRQGPVYHGDFVSKYNKAKRFANAEQNQIPQAFLPVP